MAKFNKTRQKTPGTGPIRGPKTATGRTHQGGPGFERDPKGELFLLAVSNFCGEASFYQAADARDSRYLSLVRRIAVTDPLWLERFLIWLRTAANMRSAALVGALEAAYWMVRNGIPGSRRIVAGVMRRADEPGEAIAYWNPRYGRAMPKPVKRGIADAATRLYDEYALLKYDSGRASFRFGDVLDLTHPKSTSDAQGALFKYALDRRHGRENAPPASLPLLSARAGLMALPLAERRAALRDPDRLKAAGMTWEALAGWLQGPMDAEAWTAALPGMGYMAKSRNLRNLDEAGVGDDVAARVAAELADPQRVARSKQLPMRFLAAYRATGSVRWAQALETALSHSLANVPVLKGRTLVLVDRSASMFFANSRSSDLSYGDIAAVFGSALALRAEKADLIEFGSTSRGVGFRPGDSVLRLVDRFGNLGGTETAQAVRRWFDRHDRVVIVTDEQTDGRDGDPTAAVPEDVPVYTWNLAGYKYGHGPSGRNRHTFGGLSDAAFAMVPLLEAGSRADWPF
ncbi:TROVE domain-containing protein [Phytomonospora sp. NPDC050363]|uniref:TROVE domain-containing protein n=1 Tax=Phytomonospora sp. NPDC050363 TaxID=3155642 RepID=UPI0033DE7A54